MIERQYNINFDTGEINFRDNGLFYKVNKCENQNNYNLAIVGSRSITDQQFVNRIFNAFKFMFGNPNKVISGGAKGIDSFGEQWADLNNIEKIIFKPDWDTYGKRAGFIRNEDIIKNCDVCLAIWDGESNGTKHDIQLCEENKKELVLFNYKEYINKIFSGFTYRYYNSVNIDVRSEYKFDYNNRWLPQPGIIKL